jgi:hypothetical protein
VSYEEGEDRCHSVKSLTKRYVSLLLLQIPNGQDCGRIVICISLSLQAGIEYLAELYFSIRESSKQAHGGIWYGDLPTRVLSQPCVPSL